MAISKLHILRLFFVISTFLFATPCFAELTFDDWFVGQTQEYVTTLQNEGANLTPQDIKRAKELLKTAQKKSDWTAIITETQKLLAKDPQNRELWLNLSVAFQKKNLTERRNWQNEQNAKSAAYQAYALSNTNTEKAVALLVFGDTISPSATYDSPTYLDVFTEINTLSDIKTLRKDFPDYASFMSFKFLETRVNNQNTPPNVCFVFSHPLAAKDIQYTDLISIKPAVDGSIKPYGRELCVSPVKFGETYEVTLHQGFKDQFEEPLPKPISFAFKVKDQSSKLSFGGSAYILKKGKEALIPLTAVNVETANISLLRISDRNLQAALVESYYFMTPLESYSFSEIQDKWGELVWKGEMNLNPKLNQTVTTQIPFHQMVKKLEPGVYILYAEEKNAIFNRKALATQWLIISDIGLTTFSTDRAGLYVQARSLTDATPLRDIEVQLLGYNNNLLSKINTNSEGLAVFEPTVLSGKGGNRPRLLMLNGKGGDFSFFDLEQPAFDLSDRGVSGRSISGPLDAYLYTEQGVYRPGDTVHVNALLRNTQAIAEPNFPLTFKVFRPDGVLISEETQKGNDLGSYEMDLPISSAARTGQWNVSAFVDPKKDPIGQVKFSVEDFVPSRILVSLKADKTVLTKGEALEVTVNAEYLFGGKAAGLTGKGQFSLTPIQNPFKKYEGFTFGLVEENFLPTKSELPIAPLDSQGNSLLTLNFDHPPETSKALQGVLRVSVLDQGGRPEYGILKLPVFTKPFLLGIKPAFQGDTLNAEAADASFNVIAVAPDEALQEVADLEYELFEEQVSYNWYQSNSSGPWQYKTTIDNKFIEKGTFKTSANANVNANSNQPSNIKVSIPKEGQYRLVVRDPKTLAASSVRFRKGWFQVNVGEATPDQLKLQLKEQKYKVGDTVELQINAPFDGQAILVLANDKILETRNIKISKEGTRVKFSVTEDWGSGVYSLISAFRPLSENGNEKAYLPKRAIGVAWIDVDKADQLLKVNINLPKEVRPNQTISVPLEVLQTQTNQPFTEKAEVTFMAVDEGILKLTDFVTPSPQDYFFGKKSLSIDVKDIYGKLINPIAGVLGQLRSGGDAGVLSKNMQALSKKSFKVVSLYKGLVQLDKSGKATVSLELPDFNGTLRVMAVAYSKKNIGSGAAPLLMRDPVVIEAIAPRFLAPEDESQFALSLHNVAGEEGEYTITVKAEGSVKVRKHEDKIADKTTDKEADKSVDKTANKTADKGVDKSSEKSSDHLLQFNTTLKKEGIYNTTVSLIAANLGDGKVTLQLKGPNNLSLEKSFEISVRAAHPYTSAQENHLLKPKDQIVLNDSLLKQFEEGTQTITLSLTQGVPWNVQSLLKQLSDYEYGCIEQQVSKGFGALFQLTERDKRLIDQTIANLSEIQKGNGAFALWPEDDNGVTPWITAYTADFLMDAVNQKQDVPKLTIQRVLDWLSKYVESNYDPDKPETKMNVIYSLYVLNKADRVELGSIRYFYDTYYDSLQNPLSRAMIAGLLAERGDLNRAEKAFQHIYPKSKSKEDTEHTYTQAPFGTELRDEAAILAITQKALQKAPSLKSPTVLVEQLRRDLADKLKDDNRLSTQELAWAVRASKLGENANKSPMQVTLNQKSYSSDESVLAIPLHISDFVSNAISLQNGGANDVWIHLSVSGISKEAGKANSKGITLKSQTYSLNGDPISIDKIKQGEVVIQVFEGEMQTTTPNQLLLVDLLPAGFEIENGSLAALAEKGDSSLEFLGTLTKTDHQELRDDRYVAVFKLNPNKGFKLAYRVRAVTPGEYIKPSTLVEDMYAPSHFATTEAGRVEVTK